MSSASTAAGRTRAGVWCHVPWAAVAVASFAACSASTPQRSVTSNPAAVTTTAPEAVSPVTTVPDGSTVPATTATVEATTTVPMSTLAPGEPIVVQDKVVHVDDLSASCEQAVAPIRALIAKNPSSYAISAEDAAAFNAAIAAPNALVDGVPACTADEFARFNANELQPWLSLPKP